MPIQMKEEAQRIWNTIKMDGVVKNLNFEVELQRKLLDFFHVGGYYYYIFDVLNGSFTYVSPKIKDVLGYDENEMTVEFFFSKIHPDDQSILLNFEKEVVHFFQNLPGDKIAKYKFSYDYRVKNSNDQYVRILQQVITLQFEDSKNILLTLGVHTDISHIKKENTSSLSFIGLDGEPSFIDVSVNQVLNAQKDLLTASEKKVLNLLISGYQTKEIAQLLFISTHTVTTHRKNILRKTDTKSTTELLTKIIREGMIS